MHGLTTFRAVHIIIGLGLFVFGFCLFNGFVGDDTGYIFHPYIQQFEILKLFIGGSTDLGGSSPITSQFYRPLMLLHFASLYQFFGSAPFPYHLLQVLLHIANTLLLFFFFKKFMVVPLSVFLSLLFLVHPINSETVAYISNLQDVLFVFFGMIALHILFVRVRTWKIYFSLFLLLVFSLLGKETGLLFLIMTVVTEFLFLKKDKVILSVTFSSLLFYSVLRVFVAGVWIGKSPESPLSTLTLLERVQHIPALLYYYLFTVVFPSNISLGQTWILKTVSIETFYFPLALMICLVLLCIFLGRFIKERSKRRFALYLYFILWFVIGLLPHIQLLPLEMTVATRWFYFPFIGLLGVIGVCFSFFSGKKRLRNNYLIAGIVLITFLSYATINRLFLWKDATTLYTHDVSKTESYMVENSLGYELLQQNKPDEAYVHFKKSVKLFPTAVNTNSLGVYYYQKKDIAHAKEWFYTSHQYGDNYLAYQNLSRILLQYDSPEIAKKYIAGAVNKFPQSSTLWTLYVIAQYKTNDMQGALSSAQKAYELQPTQQNEYVVSQLQQGLPLEIK